MRPTSVAMLFPTAFQTGEKRVRRQSANLQRNELGFSSLSTINTAALCCNLLDKHETSGPELGCLQATTARYLTTRRSVKRCNSVNVST